MTKIILSLFLVFSFYLSKAKTSTEELSIFFEPGQSQLNSRSQFLLDSLFSKIDPDSDFEIFLSGHTDHDGSKKFNEALSQKRAQSVSDYLISKGLDQESFTLRFFGELKPFEVEDSQNLKKLNRRVQLKISRFILENISDLENALKSPATKIRIDASKGQEIIALQGSKLTIPANAFTNEAGELVDNVEISITEALDFNDFIGNNLGTLSGDQLLVTGGMLKIEAFSTSGEKLSLTAGKSLGIEVPNDQVENGMLLFTSGSGQDWETNGTEVETPTSAGDELYKQKPYKIYPKYKMPVFSRDIKSKPIKPLQPRLQREPKRPDGKLLEKPIKWYLVWNKNKIERNRQKVYDQRMDKYDANMEKYEQRKIIYQEQLIAFLRNQKTFKKELPIWEEKQIKDSLNFRNTEVYLQAEADYQEMAEKVDMTYAKVLAKWQLKMDSLIENTENLSSKDINKYVSRTSNLNWINIDRFLKLEPWETRPVTVKESDEDEKRVIVVFEDLKTIIPLQKTMDKDYKISRIPKKNKAKVLAYKVKNGKAYVYFEKIDNSTVYQPVYKPLKIKELRKLLSSLDG